MPGITPPQAAVASAGIDAASGVINGLMQGLQNRKNRQYQDEWAYRQREWALQDWNMQNEYNSPVAQRQRMIQAGMNPALMYGSGASGGNATPVRAGSSPSYQGVAPRINTGSGANGLMAYLAVQKQTAELNQMQLQNEFLHERILGQRAVTGLTFDKSRLTAAQADKVQSWLDAVKQIDNAGLGINAFGNQLGAVASGIFQQQQLNSAKLTLTLDENTRRELYAAKNSEMVAAKLAQIAIQSAKTEQERLNLIENWKILQKSNILKQIDIDGQEILNRQFTGVAGQLLLGVLKRAGLAK